MRQTLTTLLATLAVAGCSHPLEAIDGAYEATLTLTLAGGTAAHRTHVLEGTVVASAEDSVMGTVTIEFSKTIDTTTTFCTVVLVGGVKEATPVDSGSISCRFPGEARPEPSTFVASTLTSAAPKVTGDFSGGFDAAFEGLYTRYDTVLFNTVRLVSDATVTLSVIPKP